MKRILTAIACLGTMLLGFIPAAMASPAPVEKTVHSTPRILVLNIYNVCDENGKALDNDYSLCTGSGVLISKDAQYGTVVTNAHVIAKGDAIKESGGKKFILRHIQQEAFIIFPQQNGEPRIYRVIENLLQSDVKGMQEADIAALRIAAKGLPNIIPFKGEPLKIGTMVYALGYPGVLDSEESSMVKLGQKIVQKWVEGGKLHNTYFTIENLSQVQQFLNTTITQGPVQRLDDGAGALSKVYHGAQIDHGNSGGPLVTEDGQIVGINTWGKRELASWYISMTGQTVMGMLLTNNVKFTIGKDEDTQAASESGTPAVAATPAKPAAGNAAASVAATPSGQSEKTLDNTLLYVGIGVGGVAIVALIIVMVLIAGKENVLLTIQVDSNQNSRDAGRAFPITDKMLRKGEILLGRGDMCAIKMFDEHISRAHCGIFLSGNCICITDKGSTAGTKLNGSPLTPGKPSTINKGSTLEFGKIRAHIG